MICQKMVDKKRIGDDEYYYCELIKIFKRNINDLLRYIPIPFRNLKKFSGPEIFARAVP